MQATPNEARITAKVISVIPTENNWGSWAELQILHLEDVPGKPNWVYPRGLPQSCQLKVFVPPVFTLIADKEICGNVSFNGGPFQPGIYTLIKVEDG